jgi:hypothetical protein
MQQMLARMQAQLYAGAAGAADAAPPVNLFSGDAAQMGGENCARFRRGDKNKKAAKNNPCHDEIPAGVRKYAAGHKKGIARQLNEFCEIQEISRWRRRIPANAGENPGGSPQHLLATITREARHHDILVPVPAACAQIHGWRNAQIAANGK